jgi:hypothetical protein
MSDELGVGQRRRTTRQLLVGMPLVLGLALFAAKGPTWLVDRGEKAANECLDAAAKAHGDPSRCGTGAGFAIGRLFPEVRTRAAVVEHDFARRRALIAFDDVMASKPNAARRDAAASQLIRDSPDRVVAVAYAADAGAFAPVAAADLGSASIDSRLEPAFAAITLGDVGAARAAILRGQPGGFDGVVRSGALACVLGDRVRGLALLRAAAAGREQRTGTPDAAVRVAAQHCGGTLDSVGFDPYVVPSFHARDAVIARLFDPKVQVGRRASIGAGLLRDTSIFRASTIAAFALVADGPQEPGPVALLEVIASPYVDELALDAAFAATPWQLAPSDEAFIDYVPPAWLDLAATRYAHAAQLSPERLDRDNVVLTERAAQRPRDTLRAAAELAYEFAAGYRLRRGDRPGALQSLQQWRALAPDDVRRAPLEVAVGDPTDSLATLDAWQAEQHGEDDPDLQELAGITRVFALAAIGRHAEAHAIAKTLHGSSAAWLVLATAIASGAPLQGLLPKPHKADEATPEALLAAIEAKQPVGDVGYIDSDARAVLPAVMVAIAYEARVAGQDPEVVLDKVFAQQLPSRTIALARAEAARWRSDAAAAKLWEGRASAIETLFVDDHAVVLAGIAGLW